MTGKKKIPGYAHMPEILGIFWGVLGIIGRFGASSGSFGCFLGTCGTFPAFYLLVFCKPVGIIGHNPSIIG
jgi:hypothetical protein